MWWMWILGGLAVWTVAGLALALVVGRGIRIADERAPGSEVTAPLTTADLPAAFVAGAPARVPAASPRLGPVPLPPVGVALAGLVLVVETAGFVSRLTGSSGALARALSMDGSHSVPRLLIATFFAVAAVAALSGARAQPGRRAWWLAVAAVAAGIAVVKAGSTVHADTLSAANRAVGKPAALAGSVLLAVEVLLGLWILSRGERRDRRRVLGALSGYAVAVVGLSAVSAYAGNGWGADSAAAATFLEESGEGLAGVAFLMAVLIGVAPQAVLPRAWLLRRGADAQLQAGQARPFGGPRALDS